MDSAALDRYIARSLDLLDVSPQMDEQNTRTKLVNPLVNEVLEWDLYSTEVELEYPIQMGSSKTKVDYALLLDGTPAVFIEAKGCDTRLTEHHENQLRSYMRQQWVDWGLITNGAVLELFKLEKSEDQPAVELLGESELANLRQQAWIVRTLSKDSIRSGVAGDIYRSIERRQNAISELTEHKDEITDEILRVLSERVGDSVAQQAETETKAFIDDLIESLSNGGLSEPRGREPKSVGSTGNSNPERERPEEEYIIGFRRDGNAVTHRAESQSTVMVQAVEYLISEHELIENLPSFPYVPGEKYAVLSDEPNHPNGETMKQSREIGDGYHVFTSLNRESKKRYVQRLAEMCGVEASFDGAW